MHTCFVADDAGTLTVAAFTGTAVAPDAIALTGTVDYEADASVTLSSVPYAIGDGLDQAFQVVYPPTTPAAWNPTTSPISVGGALDALVARIGIVYVFRPGGVAGANVFTSFAALYAALPGASSNGTRPSTTILVDDSFTSPAVIPAGAYNLDGVTFDSIGSSSGFGGATLNIASGVTISATSLGFQGGLVVTYLGAAPCIALAAGSLFLYVGLDTYLQSTTADAFLAVTGGSAVVLMEGAYMGDGVHATVTAASPGTCEVLAFSSEVDTAAVSGAGGAATITWTDVPPFLPQGAGTVVTQYSGVGAFTNALQGQSALPLKLGVGTSFSVAAGATLSAAQQAFSSYSLTGVVPGGGESLTLPNIVGSIWFFDLRGVTLTGTLTFTTGSGTTDAVTAANLTATGQHGVMVQVTASHVVSRLS